MNPLLYKMSENREECMSQAPRAQCVNSPDLKDISLQWYKTHYHFSFSGYKVYVSTQTRQKSPDSFTSHYLKHLSEQNKKAEPEWCAYPRIKQQI